ncbi:NADH oxidase [Corynebacterium choanae]|uniref:NADH oxidase n=2 Tax=Corynebacterium choanae TaxID=1862358 RepID=A0A3G6J8R5_9CORY|nr:NADH oxidase [Corynebacterium choanae]
MSSKLLSPYVFASGARVPNRLVKAAMEESLGAGAHVPGDAVFTLYRTWARGGTGTLITGNVMVHDAALTGPQAIVLDERQPLAPFKRWAQVAHEGGAKIWMQINHPGRQVLSGQPGVVWSPSTSQVDVGSARAKFAPAAKMTGEQIEQVIDMFITTATLAFQAGFDGVEVHAAHGYLLSQFLSPLVNERDDEWGGTLENRARMLDRIVTGIRRRVPKDFVVAVKLNSSDFQRGGFSVDDARQVIDILAQAGADLVELSGGSYESPAMTGNSADERTQAREAYFLDMAQQLLETSPLPLMVTGGVVRQSVANQVLESGVTLVGMGTALAADPNLVNTWNTDPQASPAIPRTRIANKAIASAASMAWVRWQMKRLSKNKQPILWMDPRITLALSQLGTKKANRNYGTWLQRRNAGR